jgi:hypothetical protein
VLKQNIFTENFNEKAKRKKPQQIHVEVNGFEFHGIMASS